jgi:hypothetical protein
MEIATGLFCITVSPRIAMASRDYIIDCEH